MFPFRGKEKGKNAHNCSHTRDIVWRLSFSATLYALLGLCMCLGSQTVEHT